MCLIRAFLLLTVALGCTILGHGAAINGGFELSIIHLNDFHARFEELNSISQTCTERDDECFGGFSRLYAKIMELKNEQPSSIVLDAGDNYQGTLWYRIYKWKSVQYFMNKIPFDAHTIGNHEFDDKIAGLVPLLKHFKAPVVIANMEDSEEPSLHGLYEKSIVVERNGLRIGIIGALIATTAEISDTEKVTFLDESESVNKEAARLVAEEHVDTIIILSHCGYEIDKIIAKNAGPKIGLIVGGHSHTLLYNGVPPNNFKARGKYPTVITHSDGRKVLIVQALAFTFFLGHLHVGYNIEGDVISWSGNPIYLNETIAQDPQINEEIAEWRSGLEELENEIVGETLVYLNKQYCATAECNMGNLIVDSMVNAHLDGENIKGPVIGLINSGGIRNSIGIGEITLGNLYEVLPFENTVDVAELQGKYIKEALEHSAKPFSMGGFGFLQVSGLKVVFNITNEVGSKLQSLKVWCDHCTEPIFEDIDMEKYYTIVASDFVMAGKDGLTMISENIINFKSGEEDIKVLTRYVTQQSPITQITEGRIITVL